MEELKHDLLRVKYTRVLHEDAEDMKYNAPHHFVIEAVADGHEVARVDFQEGPILECGLNGVSNEDLIHMVIARLNGFQNGPYACRENALAITKFEEGLMWLKKRTDARVARGVEGKSIV